MKLNNLNKIFSILIILPNIYFVPLTIKIIYTSGGPMGFGWYIIPFTFAMNLFLIPAIKVLKKQNENNTTLFIVNSIGILIGLFLIVTFMTT
jgi:hypothetical protein